MYGTREQHSRLRQKIVAIAELHQELIHQVLSERGPLIHGSYGERRRKCGKAGCRCARGEWHYSKYLSGSDGGKVRQVHVPERDAMHVSQAVARYQRFRQTRARLNEVLQLQMKLLDTLCALLVEPYPENNPLPLPTHFTATEK